MVRSGIEYIRMSPRSIFFCYPSDSYKMKLYQKSEAASLARENVYLGIIIAYMFLYNCNAHFQFIPVTPLAKK